MSLITSAKPLDAIRWRQALLFHSLMDANESAAVRERWRYAIRKRKARHVILNAPRHVTVVGLQVASPPPHPTSLYNSIPFLTLKHPTTSILPPHHSTQKAYVSFCFHCDDEASNSNFKIKCWALLFKVHANLLVNSFRVHHTNLADGHFSYGAHSGKLQNKSSSVSLFEFPNSETG